MTPRPASETPDPRAWLDDFPPQKRSGVVNLFHFAVREGARTPEAVLLAVQHTAYRRQQWVRDQATADHLARLLDSLHTDRAGALAYTRSVIDYEHLPYEARQRVKAERTFAYLKQSIV